MNIKKYSGELVPYNPESLRNSLNKSGASAKQVEVVFNKITEHLYEGITSKKLYQIAFKLLKEQNNVFAARYSLKKALRDLGPAGYYFEEWVGKLFQHYNYQTLTGQIMQGNAVTHEIDVVAERENQLFFVECKFRNTVDAKISVTTPMYYLSRVKDLSNRSFNIFGKDLQLKDGWLVTNAYLTKDSISFIEFYGMKVISWDYPKDNNIKLRVDKGALYPITCLTTITIAEKDIFLQRGCILVKDIVGNPDFIKLINPSPKKAKNILKEAKELIAIEQKNEE